MQQGERMGLIRFGSRVDVFVPAGSSVRVKVGDITVAGVTVHRGAAATMKRSIAARPRRPAGRPPRRRAAAERLHAVQSVLRHLRHRSRRRAANSRRRRAFIVLGGIADTLDGRVARATGTGSRFGEELDSLVDAISFGFAPALIMYLRRARTDGSWEWLLVFIFTSCAVMRLARFNVEQAGRKKTHFHGLPSPAAGLTLATYYWFSQTPLYNQTVILFTDSKTLADLPWHDDPARAHGGARRADDQRRALSDRADDRLQARRADRRHAASSSACVVLLVVPPRGVHLPGAARLRAVRRGQVGRLSASSADRDARRDLRHGESGRRGATTSSVDDADAPPTSRAAERPTEPPRSRRDDRARSVDARARERDADARGERPTHDAGASSPQAAPARPRRRTASAGSDIRQVLHLPTRRQIRRHESISHRRAHHAAPRHPRPAGQGRGRRAAHARLRRRARRARRPPHRRRARRAATARPPSSRRARCASGCWRIP